MARAGLAAGRAARCVWRRIWRARRVSRLSGAWTDGGATAPSFTMRARPGDWSGHRASAGGGWGEEHLTPMAGGGVAGGPRVERRGRGGEDGDGMETGRHCGSLIIDMEETE